MKITIGQFKTKEKLLETLKKNNIYVSEWAKEMIESKDFVLSKKEEVIDVEIKKVSDLGFTDWVEKDELFERIKEQGYDLLPAEAALALRFAYLDQPVDEWVTVLHDPISAYGCSSMFNVGRHIDRGQCVLGENLGSDDELDPECLVAVRLASPLDSEPENSSETLDLEKAIEIVKEAGYQVVKEL